MTRKIRIPLKPYHKMNSLEGAVGAAGGPFTPINALPHPPSILGDFEDFVGAEHLDGAATVSDVLHFLGKSLVRTTGMVDEDAAEDGDDRRPDHERVEVQRLNSRAKGVKT
jgi:hypothetical protein